MNIPDWLGHDSPLTIKQVTIRVLSVTSNNDIQLSNYLTIANENLIDASTKLLEYIMSHYVVSPSLPTFIGTMTFGGPECRIDSVEYAVKLTIWFLTEL